MTNRTLPATTWDAIASVTTDKQHLVLIEIEYTDQAEPIRVCGDNQDVTFQGNNYTGFPFDISLPNEGDGTQRARLTIQNVEGPVNADNPADGKARVSNVLRELKFVPRFTITIIVRDDPTNIVVQYKHLRLANFEVSSVSVSAEITGYDFSTTPYGRRATEIIMPGIAVA